MCQVYIEKPLFYNRFMNYIFGILIGIVVSLILFFIIKPRKNNEDNSGLNLILSQLNELSRTVDQKLTESHNAVNENLRYQSKETGEIIQSITEKLTRLDETNRQVIGFTDQLKDLQDILKNPKQRGILGEYYLETLLKNVLPVGSYQMQYKFPNGDIVDAVVFVKDKIIPIDSKFSLENYTRLVEEKDLTKKESLEKEFRGDLKKRIDETSKYVRSNEGTMEFAFMFIPHEAIYYDLLVNEVGGLKVNTRDLIEYAFREKKVIIVSPTSFLAFLQTVLQGLRALQIEESAKEIRTRVEELGNHLKAYESYHSKLGNALNTTVNQFNLSNKEFKKLNKDVVRITGTNPELETEEVKKIGEDINY